MTYLPITWWIRKCYNLALSLPTSVLLPGKSDGWRSLVSFSPWGHEESDTTEQLHFHFSFSCIEGNGNPLQCSCLENPRDGEAWWAAVSGVAQSRTWLKRLSSSSSSNHDYKSLTCLVHYLVYNQTVFRKHNILLIRELANYTLLLMNYLKSELMESTK